MRKTNYRALERKKVSGAYRRKVLGQYFLASKETGDRIVGALGSLEGAHVLEIGAGSGALTFKLAEKACRLTALEVDPALAISLGEAFQDRNQVKIIRQNVLEFDLQSWARACMPLKPVVAGNIPYRITNSLLHLLLENHRELGLVVLMLQEEVAAKLTAPPGRKPYGSLSVLASYYAELEYLFHVGREGFRPRPEVDSAVVKIDFGRPYQKRAEDERLFEKIVRRLFLDRRKQVQKVLRRDPMFSLSSATLNELACQTGLDFTRRPEEFSVGQFVTLADSLCMVKIRANN